MDKAKYNFNVVISALLTLTLGYVGLFNSDRAEGQPKATRQTLQIGSYVQERDAEKIARQLKEAGHDVSIIKVPVGTNVRYRVTVGSFKLRANAEQYRSEMMDPPFNKTALVVREIEAANMTERAPASVTEAKPSSPAVELSKPAAEAPGTEPEPETGLLGNWFGVKSKLADTGFDVLIKYKGDLTQNMGGGNKLGSDFLGNVDFMVDASLEKLLNLKGLNLVVYGLANHGGKPKEYVGDSFGTSNIEAPTTMKVYELYLRQELDDRFVAILGQRDLNADFYATESTAGLLNSAFGTSPSLSQTGVNGPSIFPTTSMALTVKYTSPTSFYFQSGAFNATAGDPSDKSGTHFTVKNDNGYLMISEAGFAAADGPSRYKFGVGVWTYSKLASAKDTTLPDSNNSGMYFIADRGFSNGIFAFAKYGLADAKVNQFSSSAEVGVGMQGMIPGREDDVFTIGLARAGVGGDYSTVNSSKTEELVLEASYKLQLVSGLNIIPDYQYVKNPGLGTLQDAQVATMRFEIEF